jgi:hypothetical protein
MQLLLTLELHFGLAAPERAVSGGEMITVADLAGLFEPLSVAASAPAVAQVTPGADMKQGVHGEEYTDIKVHCFVSCLCAALKARGIDHRPFYFGVWDADFAVNAQYALMYHTPTLSHAFFCSWFRRLYGPRLREWYDPALGKQANVARLLDLVEHRRASEHVMVMLDMFHLPERENKFNQNPFPHYLMLEKSEDATLFRVLDPDFRWEGEIAREKIIHAVMQPSVGGGYVFDAADIHPAVDAEIAAYFRACFRADEAPLFVALRRILQAHLDGENGCRLENLGMALRELPVLTIRKYAYEHGFAFFWRALELPDPEFQVICDEIEALVGGLKGLHYTLLKLGETGDRALAPSLLTEIDRLGCAESAIKSRLGTVFAQWRETRLPHAEHAA